MNKGIILLICRKFEIKSYLADILSLARSKHFKVLLREQSKHKMIINTYVTEF